MVCLEAVGHEICHDFGFHQSPTVSDTIIELDQNPTSGEYSTAQDSIVIMRPFWTDFIISSQEVAQRL